MCLAGTVVTLWSFKQEVTGLSPFTVMTTIFLTEFSEFNDNFYGKFNYDLVLTIELIFIKA